MVRDRNNQGVTADFVQCQQIIDLLMDLKKKKEKKRKGESEMPISHGNYVV